MNQSKRLFRPLSACSVKEWVWTRRGGLVVAYKDGLVCKSAWGTLPAFLKAVRERREAAVEVTI